MSDFFMRTRGHDRKVASLTDRRHPGSQSHVEPPELLFPQPPEWTLGALCAQTDPEAFYPEKGRSTRLAKQVCSVCPVRAQCLAWALERRERYGVWGGLSERERRKMREAA